MPFPPADAFAAGSFPSSSATTHTSYAPSGENQGHTAHDNTVGSDGNDGTATPSPSSPPYLGSDAAATASKFAKFAAAANSSVAV